MAAVAARKTYICSVSPIFNPNSEAKDSIITLAEKEQVIRMVKKIGGNSAKYEFGDIKGQSEKLRQQMELAKIAAGTTSRILLTGGERHRQGAVRPGYPQL